MTDINRVLKVFFILVLTILFAGGVFFSGIIQNPPKTSLSFFSPNDAFLDLQKRYTKQVQKNILDLLTPIVGQNKVRVAVQVELDLKNLSIHRRQWASGSPTQMDSFTDTDTLEKSIQNLIRSQHISVIVDGKTPQNQDVYRARTPQEMALIRRLVESAVGYTPHRGDTLEIQNMPFVYKKTPHTLHCTPLWIGLFLLFLSLALIIGSFFCCATHTQSLPQNHKGNAYSWQEIATNPQRAISILKNWIYLPIDKKTNDWTPLQKVGIVLLSLDEAIVRQILIALEDDEVRLVAKTMATLGVIPATEAQRILNELTTQMNEGASVVGNQTRVRQILAFDDIQQQKLKETLTTTHEELWQELAQLRPSLLSHRLAQMRPEVSAYLLYHLPTDLSSQILRDYPPKLAAQTLLHLSHIGHIRSTTHLKLEQDAVLAARHVLDTLQQKTGAEKTTDILDNLANTTTGHIILKDIQQDAPDLVRQVTMKLLRFTDIAHWSDEDIKTLLKQTPRKTALTALVKADLGVIGAISRNIPETLWKRLSQEIQSMQNIPESQINQARQQIVEIAKTLLQQQKIHL